MGAKNVLLGKMLGSAARLSDRQIAETIDLLVGHAAHEQASDVHIEPHERWVLVRYRIDGDLRGVYKLPLTSLPALTARLKELAGLPSETLGAPQSNSFEITIEDEPYTIRVSTMTVMGGEKTVLHLTPKLQRVPSLEALGFWGEGLERLRLALTRKQGLLLVASPKRAGKSTTLRSLLVALNRPTVSIATLEHTIEHRLPGVAQAQLGNSKTTFAEGLQALLHQDPNIVMIEQLENGATTELAVRSASSGHLILAGLYADNAPRALQHVESMGADPFALAHCLQAAVAQQLVRRLCEHCRERYAVGREEQAVIQKTFGMATAAARQRVHALEREAIRDQLSSDARASTTSSHITHLWRANPDGCTACDHTGFKGQIGIVEVLARGPQMQKALLGAHTAASLQLAALKDGFVPLALDGLLKALRGLTTIDEVLAHLAP